MPALTPVSPYPGVPVLEKVALATKAVGPATDSTATGVFKSATHLYQRFVTLQLPDADSMATLTHNGQDILVARWHGAQLPSGILSALLWDEPSYTSLLLRLPPETLQTPERVDGFLKGLFKWGEIGTLYVYLTHGHRFDSEFLRGGARFGIPKQFDRGVDVILAGVSGKAGVWLSIALAHYLESFDPGMSYIAERFPPLRDRIRAWKKAGLLAALGRVRGLDGEERDGILLTELLSRQDLTDSDFRELIERVNGIAQAKGDEPPDAIREAIRYETGARFIPIMLEYYRAEERRRPDRVEIEAMRLLSELKRTTRPDYCPLVVLFLNDHLAVEPSLEYAAQLCSTREAYEAVASLDDNIQYSKARAHALDQIGKRLGVAPR